MVESHLVGVRATHADGRWSSPAIVDSARRLAATTRRATRPRPRASTPAVVRSRGDARAADHRRGRPSSGGQLSRSPASSTAAKRARSRRANGKPKRSASSSHERVLDLQPRVHDRHRSANARPRIRRPAVTRLPGIAGSLFPGQFLATALPTVIARVPSGETLERKRRQLERWWQTVESSSGPATGLRTLFDVVAMPLFGTLGFRATGATFERARIVVRLDDGVVRRGGIDRDGVGGAVVHGVARRGRTRLARSARSGAFC